MCLMTKVCCTGCKERRDAYAVLSVANRATMRSINMLSRLG
jgi:hypothetical protein